MSIQKHHYKSQIKWTGNTGTGTRDYTSYERSHDIIIDQKNTINGSSDPAFRGEKTKHNPEELFLSSISACHMLWYLHFCSVENIIVTDYTDNAEGIMVEENNGKGRFVEITLHPLVKINDQTKIDLATKLHEKANEYCFIANSLNLKVNHQVKIEAI
jgi:organic hydroperoxide reductase OsmC/OhrA